jgi:hypothetical protein
MSLTRAEDGWRYGMGQSSQWRDKATYYWGLSKTVMDYDLSEQYAELAARYLDIAERLEDQATGIGMIEGRLSNC